MDKQDVVSALSRLRHMDEDAVRVYQDAIGKTDDAEVKRQLRAFQEDHRRHMDDLDVAIRDEGWRAVDPSEEFERLMQAFEREVVMASGGDDALMYAMDIGERATNAEYAEALRMDVDRRVEDVLRRAFSDEQRHLEFVERYVPDAFGTAGMSSLGSLETATTGEHGKPYREAPGGAGAYGGEQSTGGEQSSGGAGAYGGMGGDVGPGGGGSRSGGAVERGTRDTTGGDVTADYGMGSDRQGRHAVPPGTRGSGDADMSTTRSTPKGGLNADVRKRRESKGSEMAGGGTGAEEGHPNIAGQVEGDSGSSGSGVSGSGSGD